MSLRGERAERVPSSHVVHPSRLRAPHPGPTLCARPRLAALLEDGLDSRLTVVTGPPGSGKTSTVQAWLERRHDGCPTAWLTLERADEQQNRLWSGVLAALDGLGVPTSDLAASLSTSSPRPSESMLSDIANRVQTALPAGGILVIDRVDSLCGDNAIDALRVFCTAVPPQLSLVLVSRSNLPWSVDRLRASGHLTEVTDRHLAFSYDEADRWLRHVEGLDIADHDLAELVHRTEGWAAGLRLAIESGRGSLDGASTLRFSATDEAAVGYLNHEVLMPLDSDLRDFLLDVAILERLDADACDALTGRSDSAELLAAARGCGAFVVALDASGREFRLHRFFREFLRDAAQLRDAERQRELHRRASVLCEGCGEIDAAVRHAARAGDRARVAQLITAHAEMMRVRGDADTVRSWTTLFDDDQLDDPELAPAVIAALALIGDGRRSLRHLGRLARTDASAASNPRLVMPTLMAISQQGATDLLPEVVEAVRTAHAELSPRDERLVRFAEARIACDREDWADAAAHLDHLINDTRENDPLASILPGRMAEVLLAQGRLTESLAMADDCVERATAIGAQRHATVCPAHIAAGRVAHERYDLVEADRRLADALATVEPLRWFTVPALAALSSVRLSQGLPDEAASMLCRAGAIQRDIADSTALRRVVALGRVRLALEQGAADEAIAWAREHHNAGELPLPAALRRRLEGPPSPERWDDLIDQLSAGLAPSASISADPIDTIDELAVVATWAAEAGHDQDAVRLLRLAVALAEPEGVVRPLADRPIVCDVLQQHYVELAEASTPAYVEHVVESAAREDANRRSGRAQGDLTEQERLVLGYLADGLTYAEIGARLYLSKNTVKTHVRHVYGKLGVHRRADAVDRARQMSLGV